MAKTISTTIGYRNIGTAERIARGVLGTGLVAGGIFSASTAVGFIPLLPLLAIPVIATAIMGYCPLYEAFGINTDKDTVKIPA